MPEAKGTVKAASTPATSTKDEKTFILKLNPERVETKVLSVSQRGASNGSGRCWPEARRLLLLRDVWSYLLKRQSGSTLLEGATFAVASYWLEQHHCYNKWSYNWTFLPHFEPCVIAGFCCESK
eukprot:3511604-Rhodomonas_salina.1